MNWKMKYKSTCKYLFLSWTCFFWLISTNLVKKYVLAVNALISILGKSLHLSSSGALASPIYSAKKFFSESTGLAITWFENLSRYVMISTIGIHYRLTSLLVIYRSETCVSFKKFKLVLIISLSLSKFTQISSNLKNISFLLSEPILKLHYLPNLSFLNDNCSSYAGSSDFSYQPYLMNSFSSSLSSGTGFKACTTCIGDFVNYSNWSGSSFCY